MKSKHCDLCNRDYLINYYYTHLKSKKHNQNLKKAEVNILDVEPIKEKDNIKRLLDNVIEQIINIKNNI